MALLVANPQDSETAAPAQWTSSIDPRGVMGIQEIVWH